MLLSKDQKNAIKHINNPALVLAVPGAGKTTVIIHRTYNLIQTLNVDPLNILSITFSKASALDMKSRFIDVFPNINSKNIHFSTIHAFCYKLISEYSYRNNINYKLIENNKDINKFTLLKQIYLNVNKTYITEEKLESLINSIGYIKNMMLTADEFLEKYKIDINNFKSIYNKYETYKKDHSLLDFDDMLTITWEILNRDIYLLDKYRERYKFIQVDEGQDTSKIQLEIIKLLALPKNNLFIVADDDQSIYGFRGAYPQGLLDFNKQFKDSKIYFMEENYRSSSNIVTISNNFIKTNSFRYKKNIYTLNPPKEPINIIKVKTLQDQYDYLIKDIKGKNLENTSILFRNNLSSIGLMEVLSKNDIPFYTQDKKLKFFNHWIIKDIINFINFSKNPEDISLFEDFYYKMKGYISKKQINYAKTLNKNLNVFDRITDFPGLKHFQKRNMVNLKIDFKKLSRLNIEDSIHFIEHTLEYGDYLKDNSTKFGYIYDNLSTILFYLKMISNDCKDLESLLLKLKYLETLCSDSSKDKNGVNLSTIHGAKGLEYENVYMVDLTDGDFPSASSIDDFKKGNIENLEEERRLFYVGMTRSKQSLTLMTPKYINNNLKQASRFIDELENL